MSERNLRLADEFAPFYDNCILKNNWNGPEVIFNACSHLLHKQSEILDLGIGTGESSIRFQKEGHLITGIDGSEKMLFECNKKGIATNLILHDINISPFPFTKNQFDAVISNGLFHLIYPLEPVFEEVKRILKSNGVFCFSFENDDDTSESIEVEANIWQRETTSGVLTYKYSDNYITGLLDHFNFTLLTSRQFLAFTNKELNKDIFFNSVVAQLNRHY